MKESSNNKQLLMKEWDSVIKSKDAKLIMVGNVEGYKYRKEGKHYVVYNPSLIHKRKQGFVGDKQKTVFIGFDPKNFNFSNVSNKQVLFHVNLDEQQIISKDQAHKITQQFFDKGEQAQQDQIQGHSHPLLINASPICRYHCILSMYPDEELPQIVGSDIVLLLLNIFKLLPDVRIGYNSIGAAASVNHLHFQLIYPDQLIGSQQMPIEKAQRTSWLKSSLINPSQQINLYTVGIDISELDANEFGAQTFVLGSYSKSQDPIEFAELANSLSFVFGIIINELIELSVPHNVLIANNGQTIYIFMRDFSTKQCTYGWVDYSGVISTVDEKQYEVKQQEILTNKKKLRVQQQTIDLVKSNVKKHLSKFI